MGNKANITIKRTVSLQALLFRARQSFIIAGLLCVAFALPAAASYIPFNTNVKMNIGIGTSTPQGALVVTSGNVGIGTWTTAGGNLIVNGGGNVGIGSAWPGQLVDVQGTVRALHFVGDGSGLTGISGAITGLTQFSVPVASNATTIINGHIYDNGNIGIGSTNPGQLLDIQGTARMTGFTLNLNPNAGYVLVGNSVGVGTWMAASTLGSSGSGIVSSGTIDQMAYYTGTGTTVASLPVLTTDLTNIGIGTSGPSSLLDVNRKFNVLASGNVGIGTTMPTAKLQIVPISFAGNQSGGVSIVDASGEWPSGIFLRSNSVGNPRLALDGPAVTDSLVITNGNIGIGTTIPLQALDVEGGNIGVGTAYGYDIGGSPIAIAQPALTNYYFGDAGNLTGTGTHNTAVGTQALASVTIGGNNAALGYGALNANTSGGQNVALGFQTLQLNQTGQYNIAIGYDTLLNNTASFNSVVGGKAAQTNTSGNYNTAMGYEALYTNSGGSNDVALGYYAGAYEINSNAFYVNNVDQTNTANDKAYSLLYGTFSGTAGSRTGQQLVINGNVGIGSLVPGQALDVQGTARMTGFTLNLNPNAGYVLVGNSVGVGTWMPVSTLGGSGSGTVSTGTIDQMAYYTGNGTTIASLPVLTTDLTNIGIGSLTPGQLLDVQGTVRAISEVINAPSGSSANNFPFVLKTDSSTIDNGFQQLSKSTGDSIVFQTYYPSLNFNSYYDGTHQRAIGNDFTGDITFDPTKGAFEFDGLNKPGNGNVTTQNGVFLVNNDGHIFIGTADTSGASNGIDLIGQMAIGADYATAFTAPTNGAIIEGRVGIGLTSPGQALDVQGTVRSLAYLQTGSLPNDFTGNVGIGSAAPGQALDVKGTARMTGFTLNLNPNAGYILVGNSVGVGTWMAVSTLGSSGSGTVSSGTIDQMAYYTGTGTTVGSLPVLTTDLTNIGIGTSGPSSLLDVNRKFNVLASGNIGIGSLVPGQLLDVQGTVRDIGELVNGNIGIGTTFVNGVGEAALTVMNGNVGIGTWAPVGNFQVGSAPLFLVTANEISVGTTGTVGTGGEGLNIVLNNNNANVGGNFQNNNSAGWEGFNLYDNAGTLAASFQYGNSTSTVPSLFMGNRESGNLSIAMGSVATVTDIFTNGGNLGIGTQTRNQLTVNGGVGIGTSYNAYTQTAAPPGGLIVSGNVGLGSLTPGQALDVQGTARMTGFTLNLNPNAGYVLVGNSVGVGTWMPVSTLGASGSGTVNSGTINQMAYYTGTGTTVGSLPVLTTDLTNIGIGTSGPSSLLDVNRKFNVLASGNVGIGSLVPGQKLDVQGTVRNIGEIVNGNVGIGTSFINGAGEAALAVMDGNVGIGTWTPHAQLDVEGTLSVVSFAGNVGIGTWVPYDRLNVGSLAAGTSTNADIISNVASGLGLWPSFDLVNIDPTGTQELDYVNDTGEVASISMGGSALGGYFIIQQEKAAPMELQTNSVPAIIISATQQVGIGTILTKNSLDIATNVSIGTAYAGYQTAPPNGLIVQGNVGIGSITPGQVLDVQGTARMTGFTLNLNPNAGYVLVGNSVGVGTWMAASTLGGSSGSGTVNSGTINQMAYYTGTGTTVGSLPVLTTDLTNIGIGTSGPSSLLDVNRKFNVLASGNVGIGSLVPGQALDIQGTLRTSLGAIFNGNVGIGSSAPGQKLDVQGTVRNIGELVNGNVGIGTSFVNGVGEGALAIMNGNVGIGTWAPQYTLSINGNLGIGTLSQGSSLVVTSTGNVGIGSITPGQVLDINGAIRSTVSGNSTFAGNVGIGSATPGAPLDVNGMGRMTGFTLNLNPNAGYVLVGNSVGVGTWMAVSSLGSGAGTVSSGTINQMAYYTANGTTVSSLPVLTTDLTNIGIGTSGPSSLLDVNRKFNVLASGNVGIGSLVPGQALDIQGTIRTSLGALFNGNVGIGSSAPGQKLDVQGTVRDIGEIVNGNVGIGSASPGMTLDVQGNLRVSNGTGFNDFTTNVGINSATPGAALDVNGAARMLGFTLNLNPNAGYVLVGNSVGVGTWMAASTLGSSGSGTVSSGTINQMAYYTGTGTTVGSLPVLTTDLTNIGIGTSGPSSLLDVNRKFNVLASGNVGIGSLVPGQALDVQGTVRTSLGAIFNGNVGISSSAPGQKLDVQGTVRAIGEFINGNVGIGTSFVNGAGEAALTVMNGNIGIGTWIPHGQLDVEGTLSTASFAGNIGIGTTSPIYPLVITSTGASNNNILQLLSKDQGNDGIVFQSYYPSLNFNSYYDGTNQRAIGGDWTGALTFDPTDGNLEFDTGGASGNPGNGQVIPGFGGVFFIETDGKTGIGKVFPVNNYLDVAGSVSIGAGYANGSDTELFTAPSNGMLVQGNVGLGSTAPGQKLDIQGTARMTGFTLTGNGAANGYVMVGNSVGVGTWMPASTLPSSGGGTPGGSSTQIQYNNGGSFGGIVNSNVTATGNIGLGTTLSTNKLDIQGAVGIGTAYAGYISAPPNGLIVQGNVGIGSTNPEARLDVSGSAIDINGANGISYPTSDTVGASIAIGIGALSQQTTPAAYYNTAIGYHALNGAMTGGAIFNTAIGYDAMSSDTGGNNNIAIGYWAMLDNNGGSSNTAIGVSALQDNVSGTSNTAIGLDALQQTTGSSSTAIGDSALQDNVSGSGNTAVGVNAFLNDTGSNNTALGYLAGQGTGTTSGSEDTFIGFTAGQQISTGTYNTTLGYQAGYDLTTGSYNTILGNFITTGAGINSGSNNIIIGQDVRPGSQGGSNQLNIGNLVYATGLGSGTTASSGNVGIGTATPQETLQVVGNVGVGTSAAASTPYTLSINNVAVFNGEYNNGTQTSNFTVNWAKGNKQAVTINAAGLTANFTNPTMGVGMFQLKLVQGGSGSSTITTWTPSAGSIYWAGGAAPVLSTTAGYVDILSCYYDAINYYCTATTGFAA